MTTAPFLFILVGTLCLWICYGARSVHFTVSPGRKGTYTLSTHSAAQSSKRFKPLFVTMLLWQGHCWIGKKHKQKRQTVHGACNLTKLHFKILIYLFLISNSVWAIFSLRDHQQITFVTLNRFCPLSKPPPPIHLFLTDKTKLDGIPSKSKWKLHVLWYIVVPRFWRYFL